MTERTDVIELVYGREGKDPTFTGYLDTGLDPRLTFMGMTFAQMLEFASDALKRLPEHRLLMRRVEAAYPMAVPPSIEELLRTDLAAAVQALSPAPQRIQVTAPRQKVFQGLRRGLDTVADSLGEEVFLKAREGRDGLEVENPLTGRWTPTSTDPEKLRKAFGLVFHLPGWASVKTSQLIAGSAERYYLPRKWNPSQGWISHDLLTYMYDMYRKEKSDVIND